MAGRLKYRKVVRQIHLFASIIILAYLLMYFVTSFIMIRHDWFPHPEPKVSYETRQITVDTLTTDFKTLGKLFKEQLDITGREDPPFVQKDGKWVYNIYKPGLAYNLVLDTKTQVLTIKKTEQATLSRISSRLHLMKYYKGGLKYIIWAFMYDIASVSMLVFAVSGIFIWIKMGREYRYGIYYLLAGFIFTLGVLGYLLFT